MKKCGVLFIIQAIVWLVFGVIRPNLSFQLDTNNKPASAKGDLTLS